jgi:hypothetical protein
LLIPDNDQIEDNLDIKDNQNNVALEDIDENEELIIDIDNSYEADRSKNQEYLFEDDSLNIDNQISSELILNDNSTEFNIPDIYKLDSFILDTENNYNKNEYKKSNYSEIFDKKNHRDYNYDDVYLNLDEVYGYNQSTPSDSLTEDEFQKNQIAPLTNSEIDNLLNNI